MTILYACLTGYLLGSCLFAVILSRFLDYPDPRKHGSKNPGASNVIRLAGVKKGVIALLSDMAKGLVAILIIKYLIFFKTTPQYSIIGMGAIAVVIGHLFPIWFRFNGGKGVAAFFGSLLGIHFLAAIAGIISWLCLMLLFRIASISSLVGVMVSLIISLALVLHGDPNGGAFFPTLVAGGLVIWAHRENIQKLKDGNENKV